jgi:tetratricopeptide (TPR) repeat protein
MLCLFAHLIIAGMSLGEDSAQVWINRGKQAYAQLQLQEAATDFEKAVLADPNSAEARLSYGVVCLFLYQNGIGTAIPGFLDRRIARRWSDADVKAEVQRIQSVIAEQNATKGARAEENLRRATELDPANEVVAMSYLAALYYWWVDSNTDSLGNQRRSRRDDALRVYKQNSRNLSPAQIRQQRLRRDLLREGFRRYAGRWLSSSD